MKGQSVAVDFFAGCGGLSLGLKRAGFDVRAAVELDAVAAQTYRANHRGTKLIEDDIRNVTADDIMTAAGGRPALVAGCAPCQGFCSLTSKYKREDPRNGLVMDMLRLIEGLRPTAVMMENVPGLVTRGEDIFKRFVVGLRAIGYLPHWRVLQMADYGVPQSRRRLILLAGRGFVIPFPEPTHARVPTKGKKLWVPLRSKLQLGSPPVKLSATWRNDEGPQAFNWHVVRDLQPQTRARLAAATPGQTWLTVAENLRPECHRDGYTGFTNVYGRMAWDEVAPTITTGCTTPAKGRFGHPDRRRTTISVREAAILQTFPPKYKLRTDLIDEACNMLGNAVPPHFARVIGRSVADAISRHEETLAR
ncbi:MAG TPA: DNA cytosine methyltransferase [Thermoanaerobaculia bacterium]|jgi:DNA (cytosine-5)-methyltransferase 1